MTNYRRGRDAEYDLKRIFEQNGWRVVRAAGSRGPIDLVAFNKHGRVRMIQVKRQKKEKSYLKEIREIQEFRVLYPSFSWELWLKKDGGNFRRIDEEADA
jgi:Holliday junction resolvase